MHMFSFWDFQVSYKERNTCEEKKRLSVYVFVRMFLPVPKYSYLVINNLKLFDCIFCTYTFCRYGD